MEVKLLDLREITMKTKKTLSTLFAIVLLMTCFISSSAYAGESEYEACIIPAASNADAVYQAGVKGDDGRWYFSSVSEAINAANICDMETKDIRSACIGEKEFASDRVVLLKDVSELIGTWPWYGGESDGTYFGSYYGIHKGIILDLNGHKIGGIVPGIIFDDATLVVTSSKPGAEFLGYQGIFDRLEPGIDDEPGTGHCTGKIFLDLKNIYIGGNVWIGAHDYSIINYENANISVQDDGTGGSVSYPNEGDIVEYTYLAYIKPAASNADREYPNAIKKENGNWYYANLNKAITDADTCHMDAADIKDACSGKAEFDSDCIVLMADNKSYIGGKNDGTDGHGKNSSGNYYGIHKGVVIDLNGYSVASIAPGIIENGETLVVFSSKSGSDITNKTIDDEGGKGYCTGNIFMDFKNINVGGDIWIGAHNYTFLNFLDGKANVKDDETGGNVIYLDRNVYIKPADSNAQYEHGTKGKDGLWYYVDLTQAINDANACKMSIDDINKTCSGDKNFTCDRIVLLEDWEKELSPKKGVVIDMNGHNIASINPGSIDSSETLVVYSSKEDAKITSKEIGKENSNSGKVFLDLKNIYVGGNLRLGAHQYYLSNFESANINVAYSENGGTTNYMQEWTPEFDSNNHLIFNSAGYVENGNTITISTPDALLEFFNRAMTSNFNNKTIELANDIIFNVPELSGSNQNLYKELGNLFSRDKNFKLGFMGTFDGKGHKIVGLKYAATKDGYCALFPRVKDGTIKNLTLDNCGNVVTIDGKTTELLGVSAIVGKADWSSNRQVTIDNVTVLNNCTYCGGKYLAGIVADSYMYVETNIKNCRVDATLKSAGTYVGGIMAYCEQDTMAFISDCTTNAKIEDEKSTCSAAAGIIGRVDGFGKITNCVSNSVLVQSSGKAVASNVGGIVGYMDCQIPSLGSNANLDKEYSGYITGCTNNGNIYASSHAGGIVAYIGNKDNDQKYNLSGNTNNGEVLSDNGFVGGIIGFLNSDGYQMVNNNKNNGHVLTNATNSSGYYAGGIVGANNAPGNFSNCTNTALIESMGGGYAGWLLGYNEDNGIDSTNSKNTGRVHFRKEYYSGKSVKIGTGYGGAASIINGLNPGILGACIAVLIAALAAIVIVKRQRGVNGGVNGDGSI